MENGFISYYDTPPKARVRQLRLIVVPFKLRKVVMSAWHVSPLSGHRHAHRTLYRKLEWFWWPMVNN